MIVHPLCTHISNMQIVRICVHSQCSSCVFTYIIVTAFCTLARDTVHPGLCVTIQPCHAPQFSHSQCIQLLNCCIYSCPSWPSPPHTHTHSQCSVYFFSLSCQPWLPSLLTGGWFRLCSQTFSSLPKALPLMSTSLTSCPPCCLCSRWRNQCRLALSGGLAHQAFGYAILPDFCSIGAYGARD